MSYVLTGGWHVQRQLQYIEEVTYGTTPTDPTFVHAGPIVELNDSQEAQSIKYRQIGSRDLYAAIKTGELYSFDVTFNPLATDILQYCINKETDGSKNIGKSLSFIKSQKVNGTEMYTIYKGCRAESVDLSVTSDGAVEISATFQCKEITTPSTTHGLGTVTWGTNPTSTPWTNLTSGSGPLRFDTAVATHGYTSEKAVDTGSFSMSVTHNLERVKPNGELVVKFVEPTLRDVTFEFSTWYKDTTLIANQKALDKVGMEYILKPAPGGARLDFTDSYIETMGTSDSTGTTEPKTLDFTGTAVAVACTDLT
jgi:hypothetical protein